MKDLKGEMIKLQKASKDRNIFAEEFSQVKMSNTICEANVTELSSFQNSINRVLKNSVPILKNLEITSRELKKKVVSQGRLLEKTQKPKYEMGWIANMVGCPAPIQEDVDLTWFDQMEDSLHQIYIEVSSCTSPLELLHYEVSE
eukprot:Pgem_evm1s5653